MLKNTDIVLFDTPQRRLLYPFTQTRSVADIRFGIFTSRERWEKISGNHIKILTAAYLQNTEPSVSSGEKLYINASVLPNNILLEFLNRLNSNEAILSKNRVIAFMGSNTDFKTIEDITPSKFNKIIECNDDIIQFIYPWHLFQYNDKAIHFDFDLLTGGRHSNPLSDTNRIVAAGNIFAEDGAIVEHSIINASAGPVYIGRNATIMEGCMIRGPFVLGEGAVLKMGTSIYGATSIGPFCQAGGEIKNSIIMGNSNKAHHGYLGDSVIGEWCNLGAGTSNSNIKNNACDIFIKIENETLNIGLKCGVMMGDYTRTAINTSLNTATFAGVACNIFGNGLTPKYIPDFTWGLGEQYVFDKALQHIDNWKKLKNSKLIDTEIEILNYLYKTKLQ